MSTTESTRQAIKLFRDHGGLLRTGEALALGVHPRTLYALRDAGLLERQERGLYRLAELPPLGNPDLVTVALKVPGGGDLCDLGAGIPRADDADPSPGGPGSGAGFLSPRLTQPPLRLFWFSGAAWSEGVETHEVDGVQVRMYSPPKSVADAFKLRNRIGLDVAIEALKAYRQSVTFDANELIYHARVCRVERVMRPYLEAIL